jgi:hypothetical protein
MHRPALQSTHLQCCDAIHVKRWGSRIHVKRWESRIHVKRWESRIHVKRWESRPTERLTCMCACLCSFPPFVVVFHYTMPCAIFEHQHIDTSCTERHAMAESMVETRAPNQMVQGRLDDELNLAGEYCTPPQHGCPFSPLVGMVALLMALAPNRTNNTSTRAQDHLQREKHLTAHACSGLCDIHRWCGARSVMHDRVHASFVSHDTRDIA